MAERRPYKPKKPESSPEQVIIEGVLKGIWQIGSAIFGLFRGGKKPSRSAARREELEALAGHWEQVELMALQEASRLQAVSEADKILDAALQLHRVPGQTMGERLKAAEAKLPGSLYQEVWEAHKLRNVIAHEVGAQISDGQIRQAVGAFRNALYKLGVLS
jgi:hypothetical protein